MEKNPRRKKNHENKEVRGGGKREGVRRGGVKRRG